MLRGLIIRQAFVVLDLGLAVLAVVVACFVVGKIGGTRGSDVSPNAGPTEELAKLDVAGVGPLADYLAIAQSGMFGKAGNPPPKEPKETEKKTDDVKEVETTLPLKLRGAIAAGPDNELSNAVIENTRTKVTDTYYLGQPVMENVTLVEVHGRKVILFNKAKRLREVLEMEEQTGVQIASAPGRPMPSPASRPRPNSKGVVIKRHEVAQELSTENVANLVTTVAPSLYEDENGNVAGITSSNISSIPLAQKMGLEDGDVLQTVNGIKIDSQDKIPEIVQKFGNLNVFRLGILRDGKPQVITFRLE
jgi:type II secretory pathway component PulC